MKPTLLILALLSVCTITYADTYVRPHVRSDGTYVEGHYRSSPDSSRLNNYSTEGNYNPYTGKAGSEPMFPSYNPPRQRSYDSNPYGGSRHRDSLFND